MLLDELPDLVLHEICLKLDAKDIESLLNTSRRFFHHIRNNRLHYSKKLAVLIEIHVNEAGKRKIVVEMNGTRYTERMNLPIVGHRLNRLLDILGVCRSRYIECQTILPISIENIFNSFNPTYFVSYDHEELVNRSILWWKQIKRIELNNVIDYRRYLPHFDRFTAITLESSFAKNLSEILQPMETKNLMHLIIKGKGKLECTEDDLQKISKLSNQMVYLELESMSETSNISANAILDFYENGSFGQLSYVKLSQTVPVDMVDCLNNRSWLRNHSIQNNKCVRLFRKNGMKCCIDYVGE